jgi:hypothetical protein
MIAWFELIGLMLLGPRKAIRRIIRQKPVVPALLVAALALGASAILEQLPRAGGFPGGGAAFARRLGLELVIVLVGLFALGALIHLFADWLRGGGSGTALFLCLLFSLAPLLFAAAGGLLLHLAHAPQMAYDLWFLLLAVWSLVLVLRAIQENYRFGFGRALASLVLPLVLIAMAVCAVSVRLLV